MMIVKMGNKKISTIITSGKSIYFCTPIYIYFFFFAVPPAFHSLSIFTENLIYLRSKSVQPGSTSIYFESK